MIQTMQLDDSTLEKIGAASAVALYGLVRLVKHWFTSDRTLESLQEISAGIEQLREMRERETVDDDINKLVAAGLTQAQQIHGLQVTVSAHGERFDRIESRLDRRE